MANIEETMHEIFGSGDEDESMTSNQSNNDLSSEFDLHGDDPNNEIGIYQIYYSVIHSINYTRGFFIFIFCFFR